MFLMYDSAMIGQIEKSRQYAAQPERITLNGNGSIRLDGWNHEHVLIPNGRFYDCSCSLYQARGICSHTMTLERLGMCPMRRPDNGCASEAVLPKEELTIAPSDHRSELSGRS